MITYRLQARHPNTLIHHVHKVVGQVLPRIGETVHYSFKDFPISHTSWIVADVQHEWWSGIEEMEATCTLVRQV